jgi:formate-dependent nitrite reductase membrane component NrfD
VSAAEEPLEFRPAIGARGEPGRWQRALPGARVERARPDFGDAWWSFLYRPGDTRYDSAEADGVAESARRMREGAMPDVRGPMVKPPVWTWEVPIYFWAGGVASGAAFVALACDLAGDHRSARIARRVSLGAVAPAPLLLIGDLGRPARFLNMLRIFKPRSPMNLGAWCLVAFSTTSAGGVGADLIGKPKLARPLGAATALLGGYLGSYTGVLLACTSVPLWSRSRALLGPIFVSTATATGAAATRLALVARGLPDRHPTRTALGWVETGSMLVELGLSAVNERHAGEASRALVRGKAGRTYRLAQALVALGLLTRVVPTDSRPRVRDLASLAYLAGGLAFRFAWVQAGRASAADDVAAAELARERLARGIGSPRLESTVRRPLPLPAVRRLWSESVRRASLAVERAVRSS